MQRFSFALVLALLACFASACQPVRHYNRLQIAPFIGSLPRKQYGTVRVFQTINEIKQPYEVVGIMSCEGSAAEEAAIVNAMLYRAADMGADGLLLNAPRVGAEEVGGNQVDVRAGWMTLLADGNQRAYRAQAIRFKD